MTDSEREKIIQEFFDEISEDSSFEDTVNKVIGISDTEKRAVISMRYCDIVIDDTFFYFGWNYPSNGCLSEDYYIRTLFKPLVKFVPEENKNYYEAIMFFYDGNISKCFDLLKKDIIECIKNKDKLDEFWFKYNYLIFKGSIPKLYDYILKAISTEKYEKGLPELIQASKIYYCTTDNVRLEEAATKALIAAPDSLLAKELMAVAWYHNKRWHNTIALLEEIENGYIIPEDERLSVLAWCKSKTRDRKGAIEYYKKCLEIAPMKPWARNNLAYEYFVTRQYQKAEKEYRKCIDDKADLKYACTGYVRTLVALGKFEEAEKFIKTSPEKIYKHALDELQAAKTGTKKYHSEAYDDQENEESSENVIIERKSTSQFSKESILEDELTERLSVGTSVFGVPLKIYKRKGIYGRQWIFPVGRIDLLAEDNEGNLYVIELKKDSGYDDAYAQTVKYVEWFEKSKYAKGKKVYGIICVNDPPEKLIRSIRNDKRIRLFEYQVSYIERK